MSDAIVREAILEGKGGTSILQELEIEKRNFRLQQVFDDVFSLIRFKAKEKGLELAFQVAPDVPLILKGDPLRLGQRGFAETFMRAQQSEDPEGATRAAHSLKGAAGNIGAMGIQLAAQALESACTQRDTEKAIQSALKQVINELAPVIDGLEDFIVSG